ncbi:MAG: tetratricopeptide repeat protein [Candidatus Zipacnadales bacterium]
MRQRRLLAITRLTKLGVVLLGVAACANGEEKVNDPFQAARQAAASGDLKRAIAVLDRLAGSGYRVPQLYDLRAQYQLASGDELAAERDWQRAAALDPNHISSRLSLAQLHARHGLWPDAMNRYREVLLLNPWNVSAILGLSEAYDRMGRKVSAQELIEAASEVIDDRRLQERWVRMALDAGRPADAERALKRMAGSVAGVERSDLLVRLAELYLTTGQPENALAVAREALNTERPAGSLSKGTYDVLALATDYEVEQVIQRLTEAWHGLAEQTASREEIFASIEAHRARLAELEELLTGIAPPSERDRVHATRLYVYALVEEASLNLLVYVDVGSHERLSAFERRLDEARTELRRLMPMDESEAKRRVSG